MAIVGKFDAQTVFCVSVAARPSTLGYTLFNAAFQHAGLNMAYRPVLVDDEQGLRDAIAGMRGLRIRGCGVSMPYKRAILSLVDRIDPIARRIGAANTIVHDGGVLTAHNTDYRAAYHLLAAHGVDHSTDVLLLGAGGVASAIACALSDLGAHVTVAARSSAQGVAFARRWNARYLPFERASACAADVLINATPVGMAPDTDALPLPAAELSRFELVADLVAKPSETALVRAAQGLGKRVIRGDAFALEQAVHQYRLYTGQEPPVEVMRDALRQVNG